MFFAKNTLTVFVAAFIAAACTLPLEAASGKTMPQKRSTDFVMPLAPSPSAKPDSSLPKLGRDKHGMPFYHPKQRTRVVRTTAYTHSESDHLSYGPRNAIGTSLKYTDQVRSAAADWSVYPLGTKFKIKGQPYLYVVDDYGSALVGTGTIDIYQPNKTLMRRWGRRVVEITVVQWGSSALSMQKLDDRRRYKHCASMYSSLKKQKSNATAKSK